MGMATGWPTTDWLHWRARHAPEREALRFQGRSWTFAQLDEAVTRLALRLAALGLEPRGPPGRPPGERALDGPGGPRGGPPGG